MDGWNGCSEKDDYGEEKLKARHYVAVEQLLPDEILWAQAARTNAVLHLLVVSASLSRYNVVGDLMRPSDTAASTTL
eukprot:scaffold31875_cov94-Skeletonema_dohrnii-CCMP3373.AAC.1